MGEDIFTVLISKKTFSDPAGRFIICDLKTNGRCLTLANVYAPNEDNANFFNSFFGRLLDFDREDMIIGGDFNLVLDIGKDKKGGLARTHQNSLDVINAFCENEDLVDVCARFTWRQKRPEVHCRLDFFLVNQSILFNTNKVDILTGYKTDHSMITLHFLCILMIEAKVSGSSTPLF